MPGNFLDRIPRESIFNRDNTKEFAIFQQEVSEVLEKNEVVISGFKESMESNRSIHNKVIELDRKNYTLKFDLNDFKNDGKENLENFKTEINRETNEIGIALNELKMNQ